MKIKKIKLEKLNIINPIVSPYWAKLKATNGWLSEAYAIERDKREYQSLVLFKKMFSNFFLAYIPFSPICINGDAPLTSKELKQTLLEISKITDKTVVLFKVDLPFCYNNPSLFKNEFKINKNSIQPDITIKLNLEKSLDEIRSNYRTRAKRNLKKNKNIIVLKEVEANNENINSWYNLYKETSKRDKFKTRSLQYIKALFKATSNVKAKLILSYKDGVIVGGIIILLSKEEAVYLFGASAIIEGYSPSYSMQDYAIELCRSLGIKNYDFFGIGREGKSEHLKSLTLFKSAFGGDVIERVPTLDFPIKKQLYKIYKIAQKTRSFLC